MPGALETRHRAFLSFLYSAAAFALHMSLIRAFEVVNHQTVLLALLFLSDFQSQRTGITRANQGYSWSLSLRVFALL
jgi:hypothetical protein